MTSAFTRPLRFVIAAALVCAAPVAAAPLAAPAQAQDATSPEAHAASVELFSLLSEEMINAAMSQSNNVFWPRVEQFLDKLPNMTQEVKDEVKAAMEGEQQKFMETFVKDSPDVYAKYFTVDELNEILEFYKTPIGTKMRETFPKVNQDILTSLMSQMGALRANMDAATRSVLEKNGIPLDN